MYQIIYLIILFYFMPLINNFLEVYKIQALQGKSLLFFFGSTFLTKRKLIFLYLKQIKA